MIDRVRLRDEVTRVTDGDAEGIAFHGPSTKSNLADITPELATARPIPNGHTIWELVAHLKVGREWSLARLNGEKPDVEWWPALVSQTPRDWSSLLAGLDEVQKRFIDALPSSGDDNVLAAVRFLVHHEIYHSGQIALVRKALGLVGRPG